MMNRFKQIKSGWKQIIENPFKSVLSPLISTSKKVLEGVAVITKKASFKIPRFVYYLRIWLLMSKNSFSVWLVRRKLLFFFLLGKLLRFGFFTAFLYFLIKGADNLAGYNINQTIFFFLTFNVIDILAQFLFREVYRFRPLVVSGDFDLFLTKPMSALFRALMGGADVIDLITIPPLFAAVIYVGGMLNPSVLDTTYYIMLIINGLLIAAAFHIAVLSLGIITLEIDHTIMIYRDLTNLGRFPVDIYRQPLKGILTYLVPVGLMITLPVKALMGLVSPQGVFFSFVLGAILFFVSLRFWRFALARYTSASS
jgi:ABC-2 type transport system permease protein